MDHDPREKRRQQIRDTLDTLIADDLQTIRKGLLQQVMDPKVTLLAFTETAIAFWNRWLGVDRIFICDMRTGLVIAGWKKGKNIISLQDWDPNYVPLEDDRILQKALEGDDLVAAPVAGEGADMAFAIRFEETTWLAVFDETQVAREFNAADMAYIELIRDLILIKARLAAAS